MIDALTTGAVSHTSTVNKNIDTVIVIIFTEVGKYFSK
jgi:hypothetical protein